MKMARLASSIVSLTLALSLVCATIAAETPGRTVIGHALVSTHDPKMRIEVPASATYVGTSHWVMQQYSDDIELHAFVDADASRQVQRVYWLQFEAYLPSRPELKHTYDSKRHVTLGGMDFLVDTWVQTTVATDEPDSDDSQLQALVTGKGYTFPRSMMSVRFVHLMDGARKELMFIYSEDLAPTGYTDDDLSQGGKAYSQWPRIEKGLIERGEASIKFQ